MLFSDPADARMYARLAIVRNSTHETTRVTTPILQVYHTAVDLHPYEKEDSTRNPLAKDKKSHLLAAGTLKSKHHEPWHSINRLLKRRHCRFVLNDNSSCTKYKCYMVIFIRSQQFTAIMRSKFKQRKQHFYCHDYVYVYKTGVNSEINRTLQHRQPNVKGAGFVT